MCSAVGSDEKHNTHVDTGQIRSLTSASERAYFVYIKRLPMRLPTILLVPLQNDTLNNEMKCCWTVFGLFNITFFLFYFFYYQKAFLLWLE